MKEELAASGATATTLSDFDFEVPSTAIAQSPLADRSSAKLLVRHPNGKIQDQRVADLKDLLPAGSLLLFNDTRVFPCRLLGKKDSGGKIELLLLSLPDKDSCVWCLPRPRRRLRIGQPLYFTGSNATVVGFDDDHRVQVRFELASADIPGWLNRVGLVPLPPYLERTGAAAQDRKDYQTVYATHVGSVAAPTAGLHFDDTLMAQLRQKPIEMANVTLHVGPGTFLPVRTSNPVEHQMHAEPYTVPADTLAKLERARAEGRPVIAVGSTTFRCLEAFLRQEDPGLCDKMLTTDLFVFPKHESDRFRPSWCDAILTNFHLPQSTLVMLVAALIGMQGMRDAYGGHGLASDDDQHPARSRPRPRRAAWRARRVADRRHRLEGRPGFQPRLQRR